MPHSNHYLLFIEYFNKRKFDSAQSILGELWLKSRGKEKEFYGGLIQVAVALFHLVNENAKGAGPTYAKAKAMLVPCGESYLGIQTSKLLADLDHLFQNQVNLADPSIDYLKLVPRIEFHSDS